MAQKGPIHHQKDENSDAHIFFGLLAYWIVNTIRYRLKRKGYNSYWKSGYKKQSWAKHKKILTPRTSPFEDAKMPSRWHTCDDTAIDL